MLSTLLKRLFTAFQFLPLPVQPKAGVKSSEELASGLLTQTTKGSSEIMIKGVKREMKVKRLSDTNLKLYIAPFKNHCYPEYNILVWNFFNNSPYIFHSHFNTFHLYSTQQTYVKLHALINL